MAAISIQFVEKIVRDRTGHEQADRHADHETGEQPSRATDPKGPQIDVAAGELAEEQRGDEEARNDKEDVDAEIAAGQPGRAQVEHQDGNDCERSDAIQTRYALSARRRSGRVGARPMRSRGHASRVGTSADRAVQARCGRGGVVAF